MEAINDSSRLVAQSLQLINDYIQSNPMNDNSELFKAQRNLELALEKLADNI